MFLFAKALGPFFSKQTVIIIVFANQVESHVCMGKKIPPEIAGPNVLNKKWVANDPNPTV